MNIADAMLIGGGMAYTFLKAQGRPIGKSLVENEKLDLAKKILDDARQKNFKFLIPVDHVIAPEFKADAPATTVDVDATPDNQMGLDIGPKSIALYAADAKAKTIVWNGPMGVFKCRRSPKARWKLPRPWPPRRMAVNLLVSGGNFVAARIVGCGRDCAHFYRWGASLEFLGGRKFPGVEALTEK